MPVQKTPDADLRRRYPLYAEVGLALALGLTILAFTVPVEPEAAPPLIEATEPPIRLEEIPPTAEPPPPAPPPPVEVSDEVEVEDIIESIEINMDDALPPPGPPAKPVEFVAPAIEDPPPPPRPTLAIEDEADKVFIVAEVQPVLIGGIEGLQQRVEYPQFARQAGIEGRVTVQFVVDERGNVVDPVVLRSPNDLLSEAALKAVRESRFEPGQQRGRPVKVRFAVPVTFRLR